MLEFQLSVNELTSGLAIMIMVDKLAISQKTEVISGELAKLLCSEETLMRQNLALLNSVMVLLLTDSDSFSICRNCSSVS